MQRSVIMNYVIIMNYVVIMNNVKQHVERRKYIKGWTQPATARFGKLHGTLPGDVQRTGI